MSDAHMLRLQNRQLRHVTYVTSDKRHVTFVTWHARNVWRTYMTCHKCDMPLVWGMSHLWHHICDMQEMSDAHMWHASVECMTWLIHMQDNAFICDMPLGKKVCVCVTYVTTSDNSSGCQFSYNVRCYWGVYQSCHAVKWDMSHMRMGLFLRLSDRLQCGPAQYSAGSHIWICCLTYEYVASHMNVVSHIWMCCLTYAMRPNTM